MELQGVQRASGQCVIVFLSSFLFCVVFFSAGYKAHFPTSWTLVRFWVWTILMENKKLGLFGPIHSGEGDQSQLPQFCHHGCDLLTKLVGHPSGSRKKDVADPRVHLGGTCWDVLCTAVLPVRRALELQVTKEFKACWYWDQAMLHPCDLPKDAPWFGT